MASSQNPTATDSANELHKIIGPDSTATFEDDPTFVGSNPTAGASSENSVADEEDDELEAEDADAAEDEEDGELDEEEDVEDEADGEDGDEYDDEDDDLDDDEDDEEEDDAAEAGVGPALRLDGLLGYEDEADDVANGRSVTQGDAARAKAEAKLRDGELDDDVADDGRENAVDEDKLNSAEALDLDEDDATLDAEEVETLHKGLSVLPLPPVDVCAFAALGM